ncbi:MAG: DUF4974 domain-containing protein [Gemmatimonadetes bacterium]|nr:DUF4974 domain-containing protein [Gemmatimonadota bacterium]NIR79097.1 DUF4974 domain-containing protein [Gemmatimonadota bacterium]NIT87756.1 DUF4974 domain-containing protein [Gemmatimonadota bacterium]NIU31616.1 DUF4974 domain-containing protein [Gemmatimonadota bacterium]NIU36250.1 DUF4974 domain-containing protein [Gemmatimonadota bacterium]
MQIMDDLIIRSLQGRTTPEEERRLKVWRGREAENDEQYRALRRLWKLVGVAAPEREEDRPDPGAIIARAEAESAHSGAGGEAAPPGGEGQEPKIASGSPWRRRAIGGALAAGLVAVGFGVGALTGEPDAPTLLSETEIVTGAGEMTTLSLGDGSSIRVGPQSRLRLSEEEGRRMAWLEGRAFFGVHADAQRPFTVKTSRGEAEVLGTRFEVRTEEEFRVLVVDGSVSVSAGGAELQLSEGEMSRSVDGRRPSTERVADVYAHLDWLGNAIVFQATPFERALREIERRYGVEVSLENPALGDMTVTATFTGRPVEQVIFVLCEIVNATCTIDGDRIRVGRGGVTARLNADEP